jgi:hypothetical protein
MTDLAEIVSDSLASATEGTDEAVAPEFSDEPGSDYVRRLTNELTARGVIGGDEAVRVKRQARLAYLYMNIDECPRCHLPKVSGYVCPCGYDG